jgi:uncharacterized repeat protein (TIGR03803 family)
MKPCIKFCLPLLLAALGLMLAGRVTAQTFTTLYNFTALSGPASTNSDGGNPQAGLIVSSNTLYGTARNGGASGNGTVFALNNDGTGFTTLHSFTMLKNNTNADGALPTAGLVLSGNTLYGTTQDGGSVGNGTVFAISTDGTGFTNLHSFAGYPGEGNRPAAGLVLTNDILYGTTLFGGNSDNGTLFAVRTDGTGFTNLYSFTALSSPIPNGVNSDGANPIAPLLLSANGLYGTATYGGSSGNGTVFGINTDGTGFTNLHIFSGGSDGAIPTAGLVLLDNTLVGTASGGGTSGNGTVFALNADGTGFTNLYSFTGGSSGRDPIKRLLLSGNTLYGTTYLGGNLSSVSSGIGTVFAVNTNGMGYTNLHSFAGYPGDGANPAAELLLSGYTLYGTAQFGGSLFDGTIYSLSFRPQLTIIRCGANVILTWPTNNVGFDYTGFTLQSTTNIFPPAVWSTNSPSPVVISGQNTVTNPISGSQQFFRLSQ